MSDVDEPSGEESSSAESLVAFPARKASLLLTALTVVFCGICSWPAFELAGRGGIVSVVYAGFLCLTPGWVVFTLIGLYRVPDSQAVLALAGSVFRLIFVAFSALFVQVRMPPAPARVFLVWLIIVYLFTLAVETGLLLSLKPSAGNSGRDSAGSVDVHHTR